MQEVSKPDVTKELDANSIGNSVHNLCSIVRGIDMNTERTCAKRHVNDFYDGLRPFNHISACRRYVLKATHDLLIESCGSTIVILCQPSAITVMAGMREMIRTGSKGPRNDDR